MKKKRPLWIPVVTGLIVKDKQVLVGIRPEGQNLSGMWEFPGGKIEPGESPEIALRRELNEELGIDAEVGPLKLASTHSYGETGIVLLFYLIQYWKGEPKSIHHEKLQWIEPSKLGELSLPEANQQVLDRIQELLP